jgi:hypothetical protein
VEISLDDGKCGKDDCHHPWRRISPSTALLNLHHHHRLNHQEIKPELQKQLQKDALVLDA